MRWGRRWERSMEKEYGEGVWKEMGKEIWKEYGIGVWGEEYGERRSNIKPEDRSFGSLVRRPSLVVSLSFFLFSLPSLTFSRQPCDATPRSRIRSRSSRIVLLCISRNRNRGLRSRIRSRRPCSN